MNRHKSNPFLSGWDENEDAQAILETVLAQKNEAVSGGCAERRTSGEYAGARRHSSSSGSQPTTNQTDATSNGPDPFGGSQRASGTDRRLYHRNMSSFEAASLQLERQTQQQKLLENGGGERVNLADEASQRELIAKMTADFQSAIETSGKQFELDNADEALQMNPFDPFETIVDDDVSLASPGRLSGIPPAAETAAVSSGAPLESKGSQRHDSIDDDDDELISTPVRNIKASQAAAAKETEDDEGAASEQRAATPPPPAEHASPTIVAGTSESMAKASLFASLLAEAEPVDEQRAELSPAELSPVDAAHVLKGAERPVGYFDPFETVIDKDALTSLVNETGARSETAALDKQPVAQQLVSGRTTTPPGEAVAVPRPSVARTSAAESGGVVAASLVMASPRARPSASSKRQQNRQQQQQDSDSSESEDERFQIVIKSRESRPTPAPLPVVVPLLPPPPSKSSIRQARERGQVEDIPSPIMSYKSSISKKKSLSDSGSENESSSKINAIDEPHKTRIEHQNSKGNDQDHADEDGEDDDQENQFVIKMNKDDLDDETNDYNRPDSPLFDEDTSYTLEEFPPKYDGPGWCMMLRYPPKKKLTSNRFWKKIFVRLASVPLAPGADKKSVGSQPTQTTAEQHQQHQQQHPNLANETSQQTCIAIQIFDKQEDRKPMQEIPIQATYTVSEISSQQFDQFGKIFTIKLQYIFYKERVGVRQGQLARFIHSGHIGSSTTSGGHGVDPISIGAIKRIGAPIEHSPQVSQIIKLGCASYEDIRQFKYSLEDHLFKMPIFRDRSLSNYRTEEVQMAVRDETYIELNHIGQIIKQLARVRLFFLSFLNGTPTVEVGINDIHRQGREVVGRMDILPVITESWIRLEACELHPTVDKEAFEDPQVRIIKLIPPDATFFELLRFRVRPPRNRELPLQISANMSVTRTNVNINCDVIIAGSISRKHGQIPCEDIAIKIWIPECWIYFFREEKHFRMGSKKSVNRRPGKVKGIERFLAGGYNQDFSDNSSLIEVTSGQAKYEHHHHSIVWRATRWPKESQSAYVQNSMKIRLPLSAYDEMPESFNDIIHVEYTMPATTVSYTTLRSISVNPCSDEPAEKYVKYSAKYDYKVKMKTTINLNSGNNKLNDQQQSSQHQLNTDVINKEKSPIVILKQPEREDDLQREEDSDNSSSSSPPPPPPAVRHDSDRAGSGTSN